METTADCAFVLGLDGVPWNKIERWVLDDELPHFRQLVEEGAAAPLESTDPATTALAWPTIATGVSPDKHGVYGFQNLQPGYTNRMNTSNDIRQPELWDILSPSVVGNVPMTFPATDIDGKLVTGMMTPDRERGFTHPPELADEIDASIPDYRIGLSWEKYKDRPEAFTDELSALLAARQELMGHLMTEDDWRLFFFVYTAPDRLQHLIWEEDVLLDHYKELDEMLGSVIEYVDERDADLFVVSDHGFGPIEKFVNVNTFLETQGHLKRKGGDGTRGTLERFGLTKDRLRDGLARFGIDDEDLVEHLPRSLVDSVAEQVPGDHALYDVDFSETVAFCHAAGNVYVNDTDRFDPGLVPPARVDTVKEEVKASLESLVDPDIGERVLTVLDGDDIFPTDDDSPDLVVRGVEEHNYETANVLTDSVFSGNKGKSAGHRKSGIFLARGPDIQRGAAPTDAHVTDIAPTVLHSLGEPVPANADGRVLREVFAADSPPGRAQVETHAYGGTESADAVDADFDGVEDRLRGLGYME